MTILLVDTYSAVFRAHYALPEMSTLSGEPTSALYGFCSLLLKLLRENPNAALALAIDTPGQTFRQATYREYKAGRPATPSSLGAQLRRLPRLLEALGAPVLGAPGFEADDVLATLAERVRARPGGAIIVSGDRDLLQLAHGSVRVHFIGARGMAAVTYDEKLVTERFGLHPTRLPSYVALVGDKSDNLPGVHGIGAATARRLFASFENATELFSRLDSVNPERLRAVLKTHESAIFKNEALARLRLDVPLPENSDPKVPTSDDWGRMRREFEALEFKSLLPRLDALAGRPPASERR
ncbi:MAG TPA: 5'-3' exonuclease H3TH domain-containing protein [Polyangiaceae bacterium]|nr:5'-3' exonuclease H3TH domain-containing protein [Polyangiaceae bacterium]